MALCGFSSQALLTGTEGNDKCALPMCGSPRCKSVEECLIAVLYKKKEVRRVFAESIISQGRNSCTFPTTPRTGGLHASTDPFPSTDHGQTVGASCWGTTPPSTMGQD